MAISYKALWQEAKEEADRLRIEVARLNALIAGSPDEHLRELERTRNLVDLGAIARHMNVERLTPQQWRQRKLLPPVDFPQLAEPLWYEATIKEKFVIPTRRIWYETPHDTQVSSAA